MIGYNLLVAYLDIHGARIFHPDRVRRAEKHFLGRRHAALAHFPPYKINKCESIAPASGYVETALAAILRQYRGAARGSLLLIEGGFLAHFSRAMAYIPFA